MSSDEHRDAGATRDVLLVLQPDTELDADVVERLIGRLRTELDHSLAPLAAVGVPAAVEDAIWAGFNAALAYLSDGPSRSLGASDARG